MGGSGEAYEREDKGRVGGDEGRVGGDEGRVGGSVVCLRLKPSCQIHTQGWCSYLVTPNKQRQHVYRT